MPTCPVCSAPHAACGPSTVGTVVPVDERVTLRKEGNMGELKRYEVEVPGRNGRTHKTTLLLSDEDAQSQGLLRTTKVPGNKADTPPNTAAEPRGKKQPAARK